VIRFVLRGAGRELRGQPWRLLTLALALAAGFAAFFATAGFSARIAQGIAAESRAMLGADLVVSSRGPLPAPALAVDLPGIAARTQVSDFPTMTSTGTDAEPVSRLVEIRAIEAAYPLAGQLETAPPRGPGEPWGVLVDPGLAQAWGLRPGTPDAPPGELLAQRRGLRLGDGVVPVQAIAGRDDTRQASAFAMGPRLYLGLAQARRLGLLTPRARFSSRLLLDLRPGTDPARSAAALRALLPGTLRIQTHEEAATALAQPIRNTNLFIRQLGLFTLLLSALGAWAILAAYLKSREADAAILRCLGAPPAAPAAIFALVAALLTGVALVLGGAAGTIAARALPAVLGELMPQALRQGPPPPLPLAEAGAALLMLVLVTLPALARLRRVSPLALLRAGPAPGSRGLAWACGLGAAVLAGALVLRSAPSPRAGLATALGMAALFLALLGCYRLLLYGYRRGADRAPLALRLALGQMGAQPTLGALLMAVLGLAVFIVLSTQFIKDDLVRPLALRKGDGRRANMFFVDVQDDQTGPMTALARERSGFPPMAAPMVRARLTAIAGRPVAGGDKARGMATREQNLTWRARLADSETVTAGRIWPDDGQDRAELSLEEGFAKEIGARLGDELVFDAAGAQVRGRVTSLRHVQWQSFQPNFFIVVHPSLLKGYPAVWVLAAEVADPGARQALQNETARRFPNITTVDVADMVERVGRMLDQVALVTRALAGLMLASALLVLAASLFAGRLGRQRDLALLRTLGARHRTLLASLAWEFLLLGGSAALSAGMFAWILARAYSNRVLQLEVAPNPWSALVLTLVAAALTAAVGLAGSWRALQARPMAVLGGD